MKKKILLSILCICMVLTMMPTVGYAAAVGDLYVNGQLIYSSGGGGTGNVPNVNFDPETSTLTLTNANITQSDKNAGIYSTFPLTINLEGNNSISIATQSGSESFGIRTMGRSGVNLTIQGGGALQ
ncbi:MAG: hypothetical protein RR347_07925 [Anaerovoracaceae bacterium]